MARSAEIVALAGFDGGYVVAANDSETQSAQAYFSRDGVTWQTTELSELVDDCWSGRSHDSRVHHAAASASGVILLGSQYSYSAENCAGDSGVGGGAVAWTSSDGINWHRSQPFGGQHSIVSSAWAVPTGWEAGLTSCCDYDTIWQTTDLSTWQRKLQFEGTQNSGTSVLGAASADGVRLVAAGTDDGQVVLRSDDGETWRPLNAATGHGWPLAVLPPAPTGRAGWLLAVGDDFDHSLVLVSSDLEQWQSGELPGGRALTAAASTSSGYVISAEYPCDIVVFFGLARHISGCDATRQRQYLSVDGVNWTPVSPRLEGPVKLADGPAGVMLIGVYSGRVWVLRP